MKRFLFLVLPSILAACASSTVLAIKTPNEAAFEYTKLFAITGEFETRTSGYPANDATITAIMANKYAGGTAMAETMVAIPTPTLILTIPPDSPPCQIADLKFVSSSNAAMGGQILLGADLTNIGSTPCFLQAWPQVLLLERQGPPLDVDYGYFDVSAGDAITAATSQAQESATAEVGLWPDWSVGLSLDWQNWCGAPVSGGVVIRLTLTNDAGVIQIPTDVQAPICNASEYRSYVGISKIGPATPPQ